MEFDSSFVYWQVEGQRSIIHVESQLKRSQRIRKTKCELNVFIITSARAYVFPVPSFRRATGISILVFFGRDSENVNLFQFIYFCDSIKSIAIMGTMRGECSKRKYFWCYFNADDKELSWWNYQVVEYKLISSTYFWNYLLFEKKNAFISTMEHSW